MPATITAIAVSAARPARKRRDRPGARSRATAVSPGAGSGSRAGSGCGAGSGSWVWSGYWAACRAVLPMTLAFNLLLPAGRGFWIWWIAGNLALFHGVWRFL